MLQIEREVSKILLPTSTFLTLANSDFINWPELGTLKIPYWFLVLPQKEHLETHTIIFCHFLVFGNIFWNCIKMSKRVKMLNSNKTHYMFIPFVQYSLFDQFGPHPPLNNKARLKRPHVLQRHNPHFHTHLLKRKCATGKLSQKS